MDNSFEEYIKLLIDSGFHTKELKPIKCRFCDGKKFVESDEYYDERARVEYQVSCGDCENKLGIWAYGYWELL